MSEFELKFGGLNLHGLLQFDFWRMGRVIEGFVRARFKVLEPALAAPLRAWKIARQQSLFSIHAPS